MMSAYHDLIENTASQCSQSVCDSRHAIKRRTVCAGIPGKDAGRPHGAPAAGAGSALRLRRHSTGGGAAAQPVAGPGLSAEDAKVQTPIKPSSTLLSNPPCEPYRTAMLSLSHACLSLLAGHTPRSYLSLVAADGPRRGGPTRGGRAGGRAVRAAPGAHRGGGGRGGPGGAAERGAVAGCAAAVCARRAA